MERLGYTSELLLADKNDVLDLTFLKPIGEALAKIDSGENINGNPKIEQWYKSFRILYSYTDAYNPKTKKQEKLIKEISNKKDNSDIMNLVEISVGRLLESYFSNKMSNVRVRKTSIGDDYFGSIDYIIEFKGDDGKIEDAVGIDLTVLESVNEFEFDRRLSEKKKKKVTKPKDYIEYLKGTGRGNIKEVPRLVLHMDKDLVYHFTNNYFSDIFEFGKILTDEQIKSNLDYAIDDFNDFKKIKGLKQLMDINKINYKFLNLIDQSRCSVNKTLNNNK